MPDGAQGASRPPARTMHATGPIAQIGQQTTTKATRPIIPGLGAPSLITMKPSLKMMAELTIQQKKLHHKQPQVSALRNSERANGPEIALRLEASKRNSVFQTVLSNDS